MTEDEAKTKWCPYGRGDNDQNDRGEPKYASRCIASDCMAWRWFFILDESMPTGMNAHRTDGDGNWLGYCGLAGKP
jgi:hypothetical protein